VKAVEIGEEITISDFKANLSTRGTSSYQKIRKYILISENNRQEKKAQSEVFEERQNKEIFKTSRFR